MVGERQAVGETNDPEPPLLNRTEPRRTWSSQSWVGSNPYFALTLSLGKALKSHIPSSALEGRLEKRTMSQKEQEKNA